MGNMTHALQTLRLMESWRKGERQHVLLATFRSWFQRHPNVAAVVGDECDDGRCMHSLQRLALATACPALDTIAAVEALEYVLRNHISCVLPTHTRIDQRVDVLVAQIARSKQRASESSGARAAPSSSGASGKTGAPCLDSQYAAELDAFFATRRMMIEQKLRPLLITGDAAVILQACFQLRLVPLLQFLLSKKTHSEPVFAELNVHRASFHAYCLATMQRIGGLQPGAVNPLLSNLKLDTKLFDAVADGDWDIDIYNRAVVPIYTLLHKRTMPALKWPDAVFADKASLDLTQCVGDRLFSVLGFRLESSSGYHGLVAAVDNVRFSYGNASVPEAVAQGYVIGISDAMERYAAVRFHGTPSTEFPQFTVREPASSCDRAYANLQNLMESKQQTHIMYHNEPELHQLVLAQRRAAPTPPVSLTDNAAPAGLGKRRRNAAKSGAPAADGAAAGAAARVKIEKPPDKNVFHKQAPIDPNVVVGSKAKRCRISGDTVHFDLDRAADKGSIKLQFGIKEFNKLAKETCKTTKVCFCNALTRGDRLAFCNNETKHMDAEWHDPPNAQKFCTAINNARVAKMHGKAQN